MSSLIWIVEDDDAISELIRATVSSAGYRWQSFEDGEMFFSHTAPTEVPNLILLDVMLPIHSGYEIIEAITGSEIYKYVPVIFLTAMSSELDKVKGLEAGADDYVTKPFSVLELLARIKSTLRSEKRHSSQNGSTVEIGELLVDFASREVHVSGAEVNLTYKEFELFDLLYRNRGIVLSREHILSEIWGYDFDGDSTRTVDMHVKALRQKLGDNMRAPKYIATVRGYGYKFIKE